MPQPLKQIRVGTQGLSAAWAGSTQLYSLKDVLILESIIGCVHWEKFSEHPIQPPWVAAEEAEAQQGKGVWVEVSVSPSLPGLESGTLVPVLSWVPASLPSLPALQDSLKGKTKSEQPRRAMTCLDHPNHL